MKRIPPYAYPLSAIWLCAIGLGVFVFRTRNVPVQAVPVPELMAPTPPPPVLKHHPRAKMTTAKPTPVPPETTPTPAVSEAQLEAVRKGLSSHYTPPPLSASVINRNVKSLTFARSTDRFANVPSRNSRNFHLTLEEWTYMGQIRSVLNFVADALDHEPQNLSEYESARDAVNQACQVKDSMSVPPRFQEGDSLISLGLFDIQQAFIGFDAVVNGFGDLQQARADLASGYSLILKGIDLLKQRSNETIY